MDILCLLIHLLGLAVADLQPTALVVCAVGARDELAERARAGEPRLRNKEKNEQQKKRFLASQRPRRKQTSTSFFLAAARLSAPETMVTTLGHKMMWKR